VKKKEVPVLKKKLADNVLSAETNTDQSVKPTPTCTPAFSSSPF
jgi:hypothetical protein